MEIQTIVAVGSLIVAVVGFYLNWLNGKFKQIDTDIKAILKTMDAKNNSLSARIDADNARIDQTQAILMRLVENIGKTK